ncbi:MAG TPA: BTAD domain-containing putative transcriptional regulator [Reyranella sp.]|nr:BTAD domain-containing putative transcriptional regulator [Reyranella sp.]
MYGPSGIRLQLLGKFRVQADGPGNPTIRISARKSCALLAYLAMHPERSVGRSQLATLLWADSPDRQARQSLRQCLASLRADLAETAPDLLHLDGDVVELRLPVTAIDATALGELAVSARFDDLVRAGGLYRGPFLADLDLGVEPFDEWARGERARLETLATDVLETSAFGFDADGQGDSALEAAERLVAIDPLREDWQRLVLRLLARHRGREAALARAETFAALLKNELDVEPSPPTQALVDEIRHCPAPQAPAVVAAERTPAVVRPPAASADGPPRRRWPAIAAAVGLVAAAFGVAGFLVVDKDSPQPRAEAGQPAPGQGMPKRYIVVVGVLPFVAEEKTDELSALADHMTNNLIDEMSRAVQIRAVSAQAPQSSRDRAVDVTAVGEELGVHYLVQGHVERQGDRLAVNVELIDTRNRLQFWGNRWDEPWADRAGARVRIARELVRDLALQSIAHEAQWAAGQKDPGVAGLLAEGWAAVQRHNTASTVGDAVAFFQEALRRDPDNVVALTGIGAANAAAVTNFYVSEPEPYLTNAEAALNRAITLDPNLAGTFYWLGVVQLARLQLDEAYRSFSRSVQLSPNFALPYGQLGYIEGQRNNADKGIALIRQALELSPQDPSAGRWSMFAGQIEMERDKFPEAIGWMQKAVQAMPRNIRARVSLAAAYALAGNMKDAAEQVAAIRKLAPAEFDQVTERYITRSNNASAKGMPRLLQGWRLAREAS